MKIYSEKKSYFVAGVSICVICFFFGAALILGNAYETGAGIFLSIVVICNFLNGLRISLVSRKRYVWFKENQLEIHNFTEKRSYMKFQVTWIEEKKIIGGRGHRYVYVIHFDDAYEFQVTRDKRVEEYFQNVEMRKNEA